MDTQRIALTLSKVDLTSLRLMQIEDNPCAHLDCNSIAMDKVRLIIAGGSFPRDLMRIKI